MSGGRRGMWAPQAVAIALVVGLAAGLLAALVGVREPDRELPPPGDRIRAVVDGLRDDPFYVAPELADRLTDAQRDAVSDALDDAEAPSYVIYAAGTTDAGYYLESQALEQVMPEVGDGRYVWIDDVLDPTTDSRGMAEDDVDQDVLRARPADGLLAYATAMAAEPEQPDDTFDYWEGPGGGFAAGVLFASGGFLALLAVISFVGWVRPESLRRTGAPR